MNFDEFKREAGQSVIDDCMRMDFICALRPEQFQEVHFHAYSEHESDLRAAVDDYLCGRISIVLTGVFR